MAYYTSVCDADEYEYNCQKGGPPSSASLLMLMLRFPHRDFPIQLCSALLEAFSSTQLRYTLYRYAIRQRLSSIPMSSPHM